MKFHTNFVYTDRQTKAHHVYLKYQPILVGNILDIGADQCYLKKYLGNKANYIGIGLSSDKVDLKIDLEKQPLPYEDNSFDVVLCTDVLEHLDNIYEVFDELCRISKKYVIISLPNPHSVFWSYLKHGDYNENQHLKFYGLPSEKPEDRHKWFFSTEEAERFIQCRAKKNKMEIVQIDIEGDKMPKVSIIEKLIFKFLFKKYSNMLFNRNLYTGTLWAVLKKEAP
jgi:SAM-dependent methyltransferase